MIQNSPEQATALLTQNPQLSFGVFQALITMNLVDAVSMQKILQAHPLGYQGPSNQQPMAPQPNAPLLGKLNSMT
jgi:cleavage stimulation factor subunit 2